MALSRDIPYTLHEALQAARRILASSSTLVDRGLVETEAELLVIASYREGTGKILTRVELYSRSAEPFPSASAQRLLVMASARAEGAPIQHLTGWQTFLDHEYEVGPDVLIPRPETEFLVMTAVERLLPAPPAWGLEIGLGSGAISIELLVKFPKLRMRASEVSREAVGRAFSNAARLLGPGPDGAGRLQALSPADRMDVWGAFGASPPPGEPKADFLISNPPYLAPGDPIDEDVLRHEPELALFAPPGNPIHFYREIARGAHGFLASRGWIFLEIPVQRAGEIRRCFEAESWYTETLEDLTGRERVLVARLPGQG